MKMKKIAVLTSGRADYSIYLPLLHQLEMSHDYDLTIIAFGTHTSHYHGYSLNQIHKDGFKNVIAIDTILSDDREDSISISMGLTLIRMSEIWKDNNFDLVVCIGDRHEMFAAVSSILPFNYKIAHLHGGEKTLGAIDNSFRHGISSLADIHFTTCSQHQDRVIEIVETENRKNVFNIGALAINNIENTKMLSKSEFLKEFGYDFNNPTILFTYHPETKNLNANSDNLENILNVFDKVNENILITLPNNDSMGAKIRERLIEYSELNKTKVTTYNFLGSLGYFSAMKHCSFMMGNSSSGIIEAASLGCYVINIGDRQKGRLSSDNVFHSAANEDEILSAIKKIRSLKPYKGDNIYYQKDSAKIFIDIISNHI